ncbi:MAG: hypothetical protein V2A54_09245, partial [Bacteroidota bacterium]
ELEQLRLLCVIMQSSIIEHQRLIVKQFKMISKSNFPKPKAENISDYYLKSCIEFSFFLRGFLVYYFSNNEIGAERGKFLSGLFYETYSKHKSLFVDNGYPDVESAINDKLNLFTLFCKKYFSEYEFMNIDRNALYELFVSNPLQIKSTDIEDLNSYPINDFYTSVQVFNLDFNNNLQVFHQFLKDVDL